jgi:L-fuculokinase
MQHLSTNNCLILDIGKTNKKAFVFDEDYRVVFEKNDQIAETTDPDGYPCEDIDHLRQWIHETVTSVKNDARFRIGAANCTGYGASFVHLDEQHRVVAPLYNYLKPFPEETEALFLKKYGPRATISLKTASPFLGCLNSGLQLFWLKYTQPQVFDKIRYSLHLPQWIAFEMSKAFSGHPPTLPTAKDMTSIGCHTLLWDFTQNDYHHWVQAENLTRLLSDSRPLKAPKDPKPTPAHPVVADGLHDSSAALLPYLTGHSAPFLLVSTGTWCISLNPFNSEPLTADELAQDCLCYMTPTGQPVKAARYFGGHAHSEAVKKIAATHQVSALFYQNEQPAANQNEQKALEEYAQFMQGLMQQQIASVHLALGKTTVRQIFVDGGFSKNERYMRALAAAFPEKEVYAAEVAQATALGAALHLHAQWNTRPVPDALIQKIKILPSH